MTKALLAVRYHVSNPIILIPALVAFQSLVLLDGRAKNIVKKETSLVIGQTIESYRSKLVQSVPVQESEPHCQCKSQENSDGSMPLISVVTVVYNAEQQLEETIKSVINQSYSNIEYVIVDGGSTDRTLDIIRKHECSLSYWRSEPDDGLYDAMNKGIALCTGDIVGIINAGDKYAADALLEVANIYRDNPNSIIMGACRAFINDESHRWVIESAKVDKLPYKMVPHPSVFVPLRIYRSAGLFDTSFKISSDYDLLCRLYKEKYNFVESEKVLTVAAARGVSSDYYLTAIEFAKIQSRHHLLPFIVILLRTIFSLSKITIHYAIEHLGLWFLFENRMHGSTR